MKHTKDEIKAYASFKKDSGLSQRKLKAYRALNTYFLINKQTTDYVQNEEN